jgi:hypothetical protein
MSGIFKSVKIKQTKVCDNSYVVCRLFPHFIVVLDVGASGYQAR